MASRQTVKAVKKPGGGKIPLTDSEKLCVWMKALNYEMPNHTKPEHFDYIMHNPATRELLQKMTKTVNVKSVIDEASVEAFITMEKEETAIYGADLGKAVERIKVVELEKAKQSEAVKEKNRQLDEQIVQKEVMSSQLDSIIEAMESFEEIKLAQNELLAAKEEYLKNLNENFRDKVIQKRKELVNRLGSLSQTFESMKTDFGGSASANNFLNFDWKSQLNSEDDLIKGLNNLEAIYMEKMSNYIKSLDPDTEFGYGVSGGSVNQMQLDLEDLERLRHVLIYEGTQELLLQLDMKVLSISNQKSKELEDEIVMLANASPEVRSRMLKSAEEAFEKVKKKVETRKKSLIQKKAEKQASSLFNECRKVLDRQFDCKEKLRTFRVCIATALVYQRIRTDLLRDLLRAEKFHDSQMVESIEKFTNGMYRRAEAEELLIREITQVTRSQEPDADVTTAVNPYQRILAVKAGERQDWLTGLEQAQVEMHERIGKNQETIQELQAMFHEALKLDSVATPMENQINELVIGIRAKREALEDIQSNKPKVIKESIEAKEAALVKAKDLLRKCDDIQSKLAKFNIKTELTAKASSPSDAPVTTDH